MSAATRCAGATAPQPALGRLGQAESAPGVPPAPRAAGRSCRSNERDLAVAVCKSSSACRLNMASARGTVPEGSQGGFASSVQRFGYSGQGAASRKATRNASLQFASHSAESAWLRRTRLQDMLACRHEQIVQPARHEGFPDSLCRSGSLTRYRSFLLVLHGRTSWRPHAFWQLTRREPRIVRVTARELRVFRAYCRASHGPRGFKRGRQRTAQVIGAMHQETTIPPATLGCIAPC